MFWMQVRTMQIHCSICWQWKSHPIAQAMSTESVRRQQQGADNVWFAKVIPADFESEVTVIWQSLCHRWQNTSWSPSQTGTRDTSTFYMIWYNTPCSNNFNTFWEQFLSSPGGHQHRAISDDVESSSTCIVCLKLASAVKLSLAGQKTSFSLSNALCSPRKEITEFVKIFHTMVTLHPLFVKSMICDKTAKIITRDTKNSIIHQSSMTCANAMQCNFQSKRKSIYIGINSQNLKK